MTETAQNFTMWAGDYKEIVFTVTGITDEDSVSAIDWRMASGAFAIDKSLLSGITMDDATGVLVVTVALEPEDTEGHVGVYPHELQVTDGLGHPETVAIGTARIEAALIVPAAP
jgi:hypothetical protein